MELQINGTKLQVHEAGQGDPAILMLHCWGGDRSFLTPQIEAFSNRHRVVTPDLRGHGKSDRPEGPYTIPTFAQDALAICEQLKLDRPVIIGHSMGGNIAMEMAGLAPDRVRGVVLLDSVVVPPEGLGESFAPVLEGLASPAWQEVTKAFTGSVGGFDDRPERRQWLVDCIADNDHHVLRDTMMGVATHDSDAAAARVKAPMLYVSSGTWYTDVERFKKHCPQLVTAQLYGSGHYIPLEIPDQVNAVISRFLEVGFGS